MSLSIACRLRPYAHRPGVCAPIPLSNLFCQCFPTFLKLGLICPGGNKPLMELEIAHVGPATDFTVSLDLERPALLIWQKTPLGFQKLRLHVDPERGLILTALRGACSISTPIGSSITLQVKEEALLVPKERFQCAAEVPFERLSLGSHKAQEIFPFSMKRDLFALLPIWMRLGALVPCLSPLLHSGTAGLLQKMEVSKQQHEGGRSYEETLHTLLRTGFFDLFMPRLVDDEHQGDLLPPPQPLEDPLILLSEGSKRLRAWLLQTEDNCLHILPQLAPSFHAGRFIHAACGEMGTLSVEWTKRCIRQMQFTAKQTGSMHLKLPAKIRRFRLRFGGTNQRVTYPSDAELFFCLGQNLFFDRFEH